MNKNGDFKLGNDSKTKAQVVQLLSDRLTHTLVMGPTGAGKTSQVIMPMLRQDIYSIGFPDKGGNTAPQLGQIVFDSKGDLAANFWALGKVAEPELRKKYLKLLASIQTMFTRQIKTDIDKLSELHGVKEIVKNPASVEVNQELQDLKKVQPILKLIKSADVSLWSTSQIYKADQILLRILNDHRILSQNLLTELTDTVNHFLKHEDPVELFMPEYPNSLAIDPMAGSADDATEAIEHAFNPLPDMRSISDNETYRFNTANRLISSIVHILKFIKKSDANFSDFYGMISNANIGREMLTRYCVMVSADDPHIDDVHIDSLNNYYTTLSRHATDIQYLNIFDVIERIRKFYRSDAIRSVVKGLRATGRVIDFNKILAEGKRLAICTNVNELDSDNGRILGKLLLEQLVRAAISRSFVYRIPAILYLDDLSDYATDSLETVLNQGRSFRVGAVLVTRTLEQISRASSDNVVASIKADVRSQIIFPGISMTDAQSFVQELGDQDDTGALDSDDDSKDSLITVSHLQYGLPAYRNHRRQAYVYTRFVKNNRIERPQVANVSYLPIGLTQKLDALRSQVKLEVSEASHHARS